MNILSLSLWIIMLTVFGAQSLAACPVCFGDKNDQMVAGMNSAIWVMLGITLFMMALVSLFFIKLRQRSKHQQNPKSDTTFVSKDGILHTHHEQGVQEWKNI